MISASQDTIKFWPLGTLRVRRSSSEIYSGFFLRAASESSQRANPLFANSCQNSSSSISDQLEDPQRIQPTSSQRWVAVVWSRSWKCMDVFFCIVIVALGRCVILSALLKRKIVISLFKRFFVCYRPFFKIVVDAAKKHIILNVILNAHPIRFKPIGLKTHPRVYLWLVWWKPIKAKQ